MYLSIYFILHFFLCFYLFILFSIFLFIFFVYLFILCAICILIFVYIILSRLSVLLFTRHYIGVLTDLSLKKYITNIILE